MVYGYSKIHIKHVNALCGQNVKFFTVEAGGTNCCHRHYESINRFLLAKHSTFSQHIYAYACLHTYVLNIKSGI